MSKDFFSTLSIVFVLLKPPAPVVCLKDKRPKSRATFDHLSKKPRMKHANVTHTFCHSSKKRIKELDLHNTLLY